MKASTVNDIVAGVKELVGKDKRVEVKNVTKNNGVVCMGINIVSMGGERISPVIYFDRLAELVESGALKASEAAMSVVNTYRNERHVSVDADKLANRDYILQNVNLRIVNAKWNGEIIEKSPHIDVLDLVGIYRCEATNDRGETMSFTISTGLMKAIGISPVELDAAARRNALKERYVIRSMADIVREIAQAEDIEGTMYGDEIPMYVVTNNSRLYGASVLFNTDFLAHTADILGADLIILPSSVHEVIALPQDKCPAQVWELRSMIQSANQTVEPHERLSESVYRFCKKTGRLEIA